MEYIETSSLLTIISIREECNLAELCKDMNYEAPNMLPKDFFFVHNRKCVLKRRELQIKCNSRSFKAECRPKRSSSNMSFSCNMLIVTQNPCVEGYLVTYSFLWNGYFMTQKVFVNFFLCHFLIHDYLHYRSGGFL